MSFSVYFAGADQPISLTKLMAHGVKNVALSFQEFRRRHSGDSLDFIPEDVRIALVPGVSRKQEGFDFATLAEDYSDFVAVNHSRLSLVFDFDAAACPREVRHELRSNLGQIEEFVVFPMEDESITSLADYAYLGINAKLGKRLLRERRSLHGRRLVGSNVNSQETLSQGRFDATVSHGWIHTRRSGTLWVFDRRLHYYSPDGLQRGLRLRSRALEDMGIDPGAIARGDRDAQVDAAIKSFLLMEGALNKRRRDREAVIADITDRLPNHEEVSPEPQEPAISESVERHPAGQGESVALMMRQAEEQGLSVSAMQKVRACDGCYHADLCPLYQEHAQCRLALHSDLGTPQERAAAGRQLLEIQMERVRFSAVSEQMEGGELSRQTGTEMDRFMNMLKTFTDIESSPKGGGGGLIEDLRRVVEAGRTNGHTQIVDAEEVEDENEDVPTS